FARFDEQIGDLGGMVIVAGRDGLVAGIVGKSLVPIFLKALASGTDHALLALLALGVLSKKFLILALGSVGLLFVPVGVVDAILPIFFGGFFLVPVINVVIGAFADYYAAALACAAITQTDLVYLQPGQDRWLLFVRR